MNLRRAFALTAALLLAGCASLDAPFSRHLESAGGEVRECAQWFARLDRQVADAGVRDAQDARVPGFPYLRTSRLLAALRPLAASNEYALQALADRMRADWKLGARNHEPTGGPGRWRPPSARSARCCCATTWRSRLCATAARRRRCWETTRR
jgi:hypothetical protein